MLDVPRVYLWPLTLNQATPILNNTVRTLATSHAIFIETVSLTIINVVKDSNLKVLNAYNLSSVRLISKNFWYSESPWKTL